MKIIFLGTGTSQGIPIIGSKNSIYLSNDSKNKRLRSSIMIEKNNKYILLDCSPDFRYQMISNNLNKLDTILITHEHYDHIGGLEDIRPLNISYKNNIKKSIPIYGLDRVIKSLKKRFYYMFSYKENTKNILNISFNKIIGYYSFLTNSNVEVYPLVISHGNLSILGFRIEDIAYITDASDIPKQTLNKLNGLNILILNILRKKHNNILFSLSDTLKLINIIKPKKTYITHISSDLGCHETIQNDLPKNVYLAYDKLILKN